MNYEQRSGNGTNYSGLGGVVNGSRIGKSISPVFGRKELPKPPNNPIEPTNGSTKVPTEPINIGHIAKVSEREFIKDPGVQADVYRTVLDSVKHRGSIHSWHKYNPFDPVAINVERVDDGGNVIRVDHFVAYDSFCLGNDMYAFIPAKIFGLSDPHGNSNGNVNGAGIPSSVLVIKVLEEGKLARFDPKIGKFVPDSSLGTYLPD